MLLGQFNADIFVFADWHGTGTINDFEALNALEKIDVRGLAAITDITEVIAAASDIAGGVLIDAGGGNSIFLAGVAQGDLNATDFIF